MADNMFYQLFYARKLFLTDQECTYFAEIIMYIAIPSVTHML